MRRHLRQGRARLFVVSGGIVAALLGLGIFAVKQAGAKETKVPVPQKAVPDRRSPDKDSIEAKMHQALENKEKINQRFDEMMKEV